MTKDEMLKIVDENIERLENKDFTLYFFVIDTKGNPSSQAEYIYQTAYVLSEKGYKVKMLHQEKEFIGVGSWMGEKYANLPHANIEKENVNVSPSDFLFIPEVLANVIMQTKKLSCKRVLIVQNVYNITEFLPVSQDFETLGILDAVVTTAAQGEKLNRYFPSLRTHIVHPSLRKVFRDSDEPRKFLVNIIDKDQSEVNRIVKPFYWTNPIYKFVSFRDLRGLPQDMFAESLREAAITIWADDQTPFGTTLLEAMRCGSIVMAKIPNEPTEWMLDENGNLTDKILWVDTFEDIENYLPALIKAWLRDDLPADFREKQNAFSSLYTEEIQAAEIEQAYVKEIIEKRASEFKEVRAEINNKKEDE